MDVKLTLPAYMSSQTWWLTLVILTLGRQRQEDCSKFQQLNQYSEFEAT